MRALPILLAVTAVAGVLIQCPPDQNFPENLALGTTCGGMCGVKGSCMTGLKCQKPCEAEESASFVLVMGAPEPEGICASEVDSNPKTIPGGAIQQSVCSADVQAIAKEAVSQIDAQSNSMKSIQLTQVVKAASQVVNGIK